jgi:predicted RNase H-like HicB family nuclease
MSEAIIVGSNPSASNWVSTSASTDSKNLVTTCYILKLTKDEDGRIVVTCHNMQGVITDGEDEREAIRNGLEALNAVLEARKLDKKYNIMIIHA